MLDKLESQTEEIGSSEQSSEYDMEQPVEELPLERRVKMAEKFDFFKFVKQGDFLDAQDTINMWCMATVEEVLEGGKLLVHYDGWSSKWDQVSLNIFQSIPCIFAHILTAIPHIPIGRGSLPQAHARLHRPAEVRAPQQHATGATQAQGVQRPAPRHREG